MKPLALAFVWSLAWAAAAQLPSTPVTFACRASTADHALAALSKVAGVKLETSDATAHDVLVISVKDVPLGDLMKRIADVSSAEWRPLGSGYRLVAAESVRRREEDDALAVRTAEVRKAIVKGMKPPAPAAAGTPAAPAVTMTPFSSGGGNNPHMYEILNAVDAGAIAGLTINDRVVFSTRPTEMQRPFTDDVTPAVNALIAQHNATVAKHSAGEANPVEPPLGDQSPAFMKTMLERMSKPIGAVAKVLAVISRVGFGGFEIIQAEIRMYDLDGKCAFTETLPIEMPGAGMAALQDEMQALNPNAAKPAARTTSTPIEMSDATKEFSGVFSGVATGAGKPMKMSAGLRTMLYHPDKYDPLSFLATDEVLSLAKKQGRPVVALLPDDAISVLEFVMPGQKPTLERFEKQLADGKPMRIVPDQGWLVIKPAFPSTARDERLDRDALSTLLHAAETDGVASLDDVAAYSLRAPSPMDGGLGELYVLFFVPGAFSQGMSGLTNWETIRIYGSLDAARRETLVSGGRIPFASLTGYQLEQVRRMAFGAMSVLEVDDPSRKPEDTVPSYLRMFIGGGMNDYRDEPTEILPNGIRPDGSLTMKTTSESFAMPVSPDGALSPGPASILDAETLATYRMLREMPAYASVSAMFPSPSQVRIGQNAIYAFTFQLAAKVSMKTSLSDHHIDASSPIVAMANLPSDFEKQIEAKLAEAKKSPMGAMAALAGAMGGGAIHP